MKKKTGNLTVIEFANRTSKKKFIWIEPSCVEIELDLHTEYQMLTPEKDFRIEFDKEERIILYTQFSFGFILNKRSISSEIPNRAPWTLEMDWLEIN